LAREIKSFISVSKNHICWWKRFKTFFSWCVAYNRGAL